MARERSAQTFDLCTYDTLPLARDLFPTSRKLVRPRAAVRHRRPAQSHRALDDTRTLAQVVLALDDVKRMRARKTALVEPARPPRRRARAVRSTIALRDEAQLFRGITRAFALGRYSTCLEIVRARAGRRPLASRPSTR